MKGYSTLLLAQFLSTLFPVFGCSWKVSIFWDMSLGRHFKNFLIFREERERNIWLSFHLGNHSIGLHGIFLTNFMDKKLILAYKIVLDTFFRWVGGRYCLHVHIFSTRLTFLKATLPGTQATLNSRNGTSLRLAG